MWILGQSIECPLSQVVFSTVLKSVGFLVVSLLKHAYNHAYAIFWHTVFFLADVTIPVVYAVDKPTSRRLHEVIHTIVILNHCRWFASLCDKCAIPLVFYPCSKIRDFPRGNARKDLNH